MATVVNTPASTDSGSGMAVFLGLIVFAALIFLFMVYGLPAMQRGASAPSQIEVPVNVPDKIDVNVQQPDQGK